MRRWRRGDPAPDLSPAKRKAMEDNIDLPGLAANFMPEREPLTV